MCLNLNPGKTASCLAGKAVTDYADAAGENAVDKVMTIIAESVVNTTNTVLSGWMKIPSPNPLTTAYGGDSAAAIDPATAELIGPIASIWGSLWPLTGVFAVVGIMWAVVQMVRSNSATSLMSIVRMLAAVLAVTSFGVVALWLAIQSSDLYAPWIMERAAQDSAAAAGAGEPGSREQAMFTVEQIKRLQIFNGALVGIVVVLSNLAQMAFMILRAALLLVLVAVWPTVAAATGTEAGMAAFKKINAWLLALILYKPAAATIYALGLLLFSTSSAEVDGDPVVLLTRTVLGIVILVMAVLALPALVKFVSPPAGIGASSAFSGGAWTAGVATGAVAVAGMAATGGASKAGGAAAVTADGRGRGPESNPATGDGAKQTVPQGDGGQSPAPSPGDPGGGQGGSTVIDGGPDPSPQSPGGAKESGSNGGPDPAPPPPAGGGKGSGSNGPDPAPPPPAGGGKGSGSNGGPAPQSPAPADRGSSGPQTTGAGAGPVADPPVSTGQGARTGQHGSGAQGAGMKGAFAAGNVASTASTAAERALDNEEEQ